LECAGICHNRLKRLVEFVRNGHRQLGQTGGALSTRKPFVRQAQGFLGARLIIDIEVDAIPTKDGAIFIAQRFET
jgi:hypothetical protein